MTKYGHGKYINTWYAVHVITTRAIVTIISEVKGKVKRWLKKIGY